MALSGKGRSERRRKERIQLARGIAARFGMTSVVLLDVTDSGARIEHFPRLEIGKRGRFRFEWQHQLIETEATVRSCKVHRFKHGEKGATVYHSGLAFETYLGDSAALLLEMVTTIVSRSLAEQVANARGIGPILEEEMPVFRAGVVSGSRPDGESRHIVPAPEREVVETGYIRCTLVRGRWQKKWTSSPEQPTDGFTVSASESADHVEQLCAAYDAADTDGRTLIQLVAQATVEPQ